MAKNEWRRDSRTGLPKTVISRIDEKFLDDKGQLNLPDCTVFTRSAVASAAGYPNVARFWTDAQIDARFHTHKIKDDQGRVLVQATHADSAAAFGGILRAEAKARRVANLKRGNERSTPLVRNGGPADPKDGER